MKEIDGGWRLELEKGEAGRYRLAQLDNYRKLPRRAFPHKAPQTLQLRARASKPELPGTWGFGFWNDPFGFSLGFGSTPGRVPSLPNTVWFFFASTESHLSLNNTPGNGAMAVVFCSPRIPSLALTPAILTLPLLVWRPSSGWLRRQTSKLIQQDSASLAIDPTGWHNYELNWENDQVKFSVDKQVVLQTKVVPRPPLSLVLWLDNQFAAWRPDGRVSYGTLATPSDCWVEIKDFRLN